MNRLSIQHQQRPSQLSVAPSESMFDMESSVGDMESSFGINNNSQQKKKKMLVAKKIDIQSMQKKRLKNDHNFNIIETNEIDSDNSDSFTNEQKLDTVIQSNADYLCKSQDFSQGYFMPKQTLTLNKFQSQKETQNKLGANLGSIGSQLSKSQNITPFKINKPKNATINSQNKTQNSLKGQGFQSTFIEGRTNNTLTDFDESPIKYSYSKTMITENDYMDNNEQPDIQQKNIFLEQKLFEGYRDVTDTTHINNQGNVEPRKIVGDINMFKNSYNQQHGKDLGLGKRHHQKKKIQQSTTMGSSSIQIMNKNNEGFDFKKYKNGTKGKADLQQELQVVEKRLQIVKSIEQQKLEQLPTIIRLNETKQERIFQKYEQINNDWEKLENSLKQKVKKKFNEPSVLDIADVRQKQELKIVLEEEQKKQNLGQQIKSWQANLRSIQFKEKKVEETSEANKSALRIGKFNKSNQILDENVVEDIRKKNEKKYQVMADFPNGFYVSPCISKQQDKLIVRSTLSRQSRNRQNYSSESSLRNKSYLQQNKTVRSFFQNTPDIDNLTIQGQSQFQREKEMVKNSSNSYFVYKNPKLTAKENSQQQILQSKDDIKEEYYDPKHKGILVQYPKQKENNGPIIHPKLKKLKMFTNMFRGFKNSKETDFNVNNNVQGSQEK